MPAADLRALAAGLGMLKPCPWPLAFQHRDEDPIRHARNCPFCSGTGQRLPTEAEVRAAIFEAGWKFVRCFIASDDVTVDLDREGAGRWRQAYATRGEAVPGDLVLLALLRALEAARG